MLERELESLLQTLDVLEEVFEGDQQCGTGGGDYAAVLELCLQNGSGCTSVAASQAVLEGPPDGAAPRDVPLPRLRTAIARLGIGVVPGMLWGYTVAAVGG